MTKGTLRERADVLFSIYDVNSTGGVRFDELLKIVRVKLCSCSATRPKS